MPYMLKTDKLVVDESIDVKEHFVNVEQMLNGLKLKVDMLSFPDITASVEPVEVSKKDTVDCLVVQPEKKEMRLLYAVFKVTNFGNMSVGSYYLCIDSKSPSDDFKAMKLKLQGIPVDWEYYQAFLKLLSITWESLKELMAGSKQIS